MKVCIVDSRVKESALFLNSVQDDVFTIYLDYENDNFESIIDIIGVNHVKSIAYVAHGSFNPTYSFFKDSAFEMQVKESWQPFFDFLHTLYEVNGLRYFDFLGCNLASDDRWKQVFMWMEETNVDIRASTDVTGNLAYSGNWILEDGSVDAKEMYFKEGIENYIGLLVSGSSGVYLAISSNLQYRIKVSGPTLSYSSDYGQTWTARTVPYYSTHSRGTMVAINSTGTVIAYVGFNYNYGLNSDVIWNCGYSSDSGVNWNDNPSLRNPNTLTMSDDGNYIIAGSSIQEFTSLKLLTNLTTVVDISLPVSIGYFRKAEVSATGQYQMVASTYSNSSYLIYNSSDYGTSWQASTQFINTTLPIVQTYIDIAMSSSGQYRTVIIDKTQLYTSSNYGVSWTLCSHTFDNELSIICVSRTGQYQVCMGILGTSVKVYYSLDYGTSWVTYYTTYRSNAGYTMLLSPTGKTVYGSVNNVIIPFTLNIPSFTIPTKTLGDAPFSLEASSDSSGAFTYTSSNTSVVTIDGSTVTIVGLGSSTITASQAATTYYPSGTVTATLTVNETPTIGIFTVPTKTVGETFSLSAPSSTSSGAFTYTSSNTSVATINGSTVTTVGPGSSTITASQAAYGNYITVSVTATLNVNAAASSSGDPYITTFSNIKYKLPNILRTYRLLEYPVANDTLYINATVSELSPQEKRDIKDTFQLDTVVNGFFYESFYIGTKSINAVIDRQLNIIESNNLSNYSLTIQNEYLPYECPIQGKTTYQAKIIQIHDVTIELRKYSNPQILNGIEVSVSNPKKAKGILASNINPKNFAIKKIDNTQSMKVTDDKPYNREVKELWITTK